VNRSISKILLLVFIIITAFSACKDEDESSPLTWEANPDAVTDKERIDEEQRILDLIEASTTTDPATGLMWQDNNYIGQHAWGSADSYCNSLSLVELTGWRLPTQDELVGICQRQSILDTPDDLGTSWSSHWWSSTSAGTNSWGDATYYMINFSTSSCYSSGYRSSVDYRVRCVREP
jgi:hypothetical protein